MSTTNQNNGRKSSSSTSNSMTNTPSTTPVTIASPQGMTPLSNAPKYGRVVPNRLFVGGISTCTTEAELLQLFSTLGAVKDAKIIQDRAGVSKGYGFITFETEEEAKRIQKEAEHLFLKERKLNVAPAVKKQPFGRIFDASSPPTITTGAPAPYFIPAGSVPFYQGGVTYYPQPAHPSGDPSAHQPPVYQPPTIYPAQTGPPPPQTTAYPPMVYPTQPLYVPQQFPYQPVPYDYNYYPNGGQQYLVGNQGSAAPMQSPGSPPRTSCYNTQLPYGTDTTVYYNVPMYGGPMEGAICQDTLDMANGNLNEDNYNGTCVMSEEVGGGGVPIESEYNNNNHTIDRQSTATPVVSILSLDQRQEKDLMAMQSGRRQKSLDPPLTLLPSDHHLMGTSSRPPNGYVQTSYANAASNNLSNGFGVNCQSQSKSPPNLNNNNSNNERCDTTPWQNRQQRCESAMASRRNSSGGFSNHSYDENVINKDERKTNCTPPLPARPASYSSILHCGFSTSNKFNNFYGSYQPGGRNNNHSAGDGSSRLGRSSGGGYYLNNYYSNNHNNTRFSSSRSGTFPRRRSPFNNNNSRNNNNNNNVIPSKKPLHLYNKSGDECSSSSIPTHHYVPIMHFSNSQMPSSSCPPPSSSVGSQNFVPPIRRNRRNNNVRRNSTATTHNVGGGLGAPLNEIGAGDAPLPSADLNESCKKLESLKL